MLPAANPLAAPPPIVVSVAANPSADKPVFMPAEHPLVTKTSFLGDSNGQPYPGWAVPVGWMITMCPVVALITATVCGSSEPSRRQSGSGGGMSSSYELSNSRSAYVM